MFTVLLFWLGVVEQNDLPSLAPNNTEFAAASYHELLRVGWLEWCYEDENLQVISAGLKSKFGYS